MSSLTQTTRNRRKAKKKKAGKENKKALLKAATPKFPIHLDSETK